MKDVTTAALELVRANAALIGTALARLARDTTTTDTGVRVAARISGAASDGPHALERVAPFTPYVAEIIVEDALHAGRGARLELTVSSEATPEELRQVERCFARLRARGVAVAVQSAPTRGWPE